MPADLLVYALVAAGLVFWLRSVLGTRHGEERSHPKPFIVRDSDAADGSSMADELPKVMTQEGEIRALAKTPHAVYSIENEAAENGLIDIAQADRSFDVHFFMQGAQDAFVMIVESFAEGDRETLGDLLGDDVYAAFDGAISEREEKAHTQVTDIHAIRKVEAIEARFENKTAYITLRYLAEESSVTKDTEGNVIAGNADKVSDMKDIWVLARDVKSKDPSWRVVETRGGFDGDNELIPDSE